MLNDVITFIGGTVMKCTLLLQLETSHRFMFFYVNMWELESFGVKVVF